MGVRTEYQAVIQCDGCYRNRVEAYTRQREAIRDARAEGWSVGKIVQCAECRKLIAREVSCEQCSS